MTYRTAGKLHKIRQTTTGNLTGDNFAITVPREIATKFTNVFFTTTVTKDSIIFTSGCKLE
jgi:hypothetical protein